MALRELLLMIIIIVIVFLQSTKKKQQCWNALPGLRMVEALYFFFYQQLLIPGTVLHET